VRRTKITAALAVTAAFASVAPAMAANTTQRVTDNDVARQPENTPPTRNWVIYNRNAGSAAFRVGPGTAPLGLGSLELTTPTGADKIQAFNYDHIGTTLNSINEMGYSNYRESGDAQQTTALNMEVDINGAAPGGFTTLVFEPVYNTGQGTIADGAWQSWDAYDGGGAIWWSSNPIPGAPNRDTFVPWSTIVASNPDAVIVGGYGVNMGSGNPALTASSDALVIGYGGDRVTYDFEPYVSATTRAACQNDGWRTVTRADGSSFKNQGDCVSYVQNGK